MHLDLLEHKYFPKLLMCHTVIQFSLHFFWVGNQFEWTVNGLYTQTTFLHSQIKPASQTRLDLRVSPNRLVRDSWPYGPCPSAWWKCLLGQASIFKLRQGASLGHSCRSVGRSVVLLVCRSVCRTNLFCGILEWLMAESWWLRAEDWELKTETWRLKSEG